MNGGRFVHLTSSLSNSHVDEYALGGNDYAYFVRAYDFAGNRSVPSSPAVIGVPTGFPLPALDGAMEAERDFAA